MTRPLDRERLHPILRQQGRPGLALRAILEGNPPVFREAGPGLWALVARDEALVRPLIHRRQLGAVGLEEAELWQIAAENLDSAALKREDHGWSLAAPEAAARVLLPGWLRALGAELVAVPASGTLRVGALADASALSSGLITAWREADEPISPVLYRVDPGGGLSRWDPSPDTPGSRTQTSAWLLLQSTIYADSSPVLADAGPEDLEGCALPGFRVDAGLRSWCRWSGEPAVLPEVDEVEDAHGQRRPFPTGAAITGLLPRWFRVGPAT